MIFKNSHSIISYVLNIYIFYCYNETSNTTLLYGRMPYSPSHIEFVSSRSQCALHVYICKFYVC